MLLMCTISFSAMAEKQPQTEREKFSYAVGVQISQNLARQSLDIDSESFIQAVNDILNNKDLKLSIEEMQQVLVSYQQKQQQMRSQLASANKVNGTAFLSDNKTKDGVIETTTGLQYKIIEQGTGDRPTDSDSVSVHYEGRLINGNVFDSSYQRGKPATFPVNGVIKGWTEALKLMPVGSKWQLYIPSDMAYGERGAGGDIGPNETLIFDVELLSIQK